MKIGLSIISYVSVECLYKGHVINTDLVSYCKNIIFLVILSLALYQ